MIRLSIIIVTYNSEKDIFQCLDSIYSQSDLSHDEFEIIVVDNDSKLVDEMFSKIRTDYPSNIRLIKNPKGNGGYGQGNNVGIKEAEAPIILIMNPDIRLIEPVFRKAVEYMEAQPNISMYGMKQMLTKNIPSHNSISCTYMMNGYVYTIMTALANRRDYFNPKYMHFSGSCFFIRKSLFESIGLFDESVFMYGEEDDIHYRMKQKYGANMVYNPSLRYIHQTLERKPTLSYQKKLVEVAIRQNEKKGYSKTKTVKNRIRNNRMLLFREWLKLKLGKGNQELYDQLKSYMDYLKSLRQKSESAN